MSFIIYYMECWMQLFWYLMKFCAKKLLIYSNSQKNANYFFSTRLEICIKKKNLRSENDYWKFFEQIILNFHSILLERVRCFGEILCEKVNNKRNIEKEEYMNIKKKKEFLPSERFSAHPLIMELANRPFYLLKFAFLNDFIAELQFLISNYV